MDTPVLFERGHCASLPGLTGPERWAEDGYLVVRNVLSTNFLDTIRRTMEDVLAVLCDDFEQRTGFQLHDRCAMDRRLDGSAEADQWMLSLPRDLQHLVRGEFPLEVRTRPALAAIIHERQLTTLVARLLGSQALRMHWPPMLRFKLPHAAQTLVPLHQDAPYFPHLPSFVNVWFPLTRVDARCGGVVVLQGSHQLGPLPHREAALWGHHLDPAGLRGRFAEKRIDMEVGDALLFGGHLVHYTAPNTSQRVRLSVDSRWFTAAHTPTRQYLDAETGGVVRAF